MKTLQQEIVEGLKRSAVNYRAIAMACYVGVFPRRFYEENINIAVEMEQLAAKVESARCENCNSKDELLKGMAEALEEIVRCLSHGLQDCRASITAKDMLQKYHEHVDKQ